jgi:RNA polymerase sigma-70 factor (ECF subfamily)
MPEPPPESVLRLASRGAIDAARESRSSPLAEEVVSLFDQFRDRLLRYVLSFGLPVQDGEDVVQEVFLALFQHLRQGRSRTNLRAWIFRVAHNQALKRQNRERSGAQQQLDDEAVLADLAPDMNPNPEDQAVSNQRRQRVLAAVGALPEQDRRCLVLRAEGLRYREIAEVLDISLGAVCLSLERSLARLARAAQW